MSLCKKPFYRGSLAFGCGQCFYCGINRRREKAHRSLLESLKHGDSCFITLTYDDENLPEGGTLVIKHYQEFLKNLRSRVYPRKLRYVFVGEYGDLSQRPHYHALIFGLSMSEEETVRLAWKRGHVMVGDVTPASAAYVTGYVTKKMNHPESKCTSRCKHPPLNGRIPEFYRPSLKPGIGAPAVNDIVDVLTSDRGYLLLESTGDVPLSLKHGKRSMPLGRYLRGKIRERYGFKEKGTPPEVLTALSKKMSLLFETDVLVAEEEGKTMKQFYKERVATRKQKILNFESKHKQKKGSL